MYCGFDIDFLEQLLATALAIISSPKVLNAPPLHRTTVTNQQVTPHSSKKRKHTNNVKFKPKNHYCKSSSLVEAHEKGHASYQNG